MAVQAGGKCSNHRALKLHFDQKKSPFLFVKSKKVKCTLVQALRLCTGRTADRGSRGIALPFHDHGTKRKWGVSITPRPLFTPGKDPVPIVQEAGWAPGPVRTGAEYLASIGIRSPDRPARSQSLYRLSYRTHSYLWEIFLYTICQLKRWCLPGILGPACC